MSDITYGYKDVYCTTGTVGTSTDVVLAVQFTFYGTRSDKTEQISLSYEYEDPIFDDTNPYVAFDDWKATKMYPLLDSLVLAYKWKSAIRTRLDAADKTLVRRPIPETIATVDTTTDTTATADTAAVSNVQTQAVSTAAS